MTHKVYIESLNNFPIADWGVSAYMGFKAKGTSVFFFEDIEEVPVSPYNIVVACIETTNIYFEKLGLPPKMALNIPEEIEYLAGRGILRMTMGDFRADVDNGIVKFPFFIKGDGQAKVFVPGVVKDKGVFDFHFVDVKDEEPILISEVMNFVSEYRCYIIKGEIKGLKHYSGDMFIFPHVPTLKAAVREYKSAPNAYSMDFGINDKGETWLIECNDGWSLGNYGLDDVTYSTLLGTRWIQIMKDFNKTNKKQI